MISAMAALLRKETLISSIMASRAMKTVSRVSFLMTSALPAATLAEPKYSTFIPLSSAVSAQAFFSSLSSLALEPVSPIEEAGSANISRFCISFENICPPTISYSPPSLKSLKLCSLSVARASGSRSNMRPITMPAGVESRAWQFSTASLIPSGVVRLSRRA